MMYRNLSAHSVFAPPVSRHALSGSEVDTTDRLVAAKLNIEAYRVMSE